MGFALVMVVCFGFCSAETAMMFKQRTPYATYEACRKAADEMEAGVKSEAPETIVRAQCIPIAKKGI